MTPAAERAYQAQVRENLRRNYIAYVAHGIFGQTGMRLINAPTFIPAYVHMLSGSDWIVGLARSLQYLGMFATPLLGASLIEWRRRVLPVGFAVGVGMRLQVLGIALAGLLLPDPWRLVAVLVFLTLFGAFLGMQGVVFNFLMSKLVPVERRGVLMGLRNLCGGLGAAAAAGLGGWLVAQQALGDGYAATFLAAFVATSIGLAMLLAVREPETPDPRAPEPLRERLRRLPALLRADPGFTRYFVARAFATLARMGLPFYVLHATASTGPSGRALGLLSSAFLLAQTLSNPAWGWVADRRGFRLVFLLSLGLWATSTAALSGASDLHGFAWIFAGLGAGFGGFQMSAQNLVLEFGARDDLPMRIAVANTASEGVGAIGPLLGGAIAASISYEAVFATAIAFQLAAIAIVVLWVEEPRRRRPPGG